VELCADHNSVPGEIVPLAFPRTCRENALALGGDLFGLENVVPNVSIDKLDMLG